MSGCCRTGCFEELWRNKKEKKLRDTTLCRVGRDDRWGTDWGSLGDRSGIILGWFYNVFKRFGHAFEWFIIDFWPNK